MKIIDKFTSSLNGSQNSDIPESLKSGFKAKSDNHGINLEGIEIPSNYSIFLILHQGL